MPDKETQIIETAIRLFAEEGTSVPTSKIAKEAGVSNGTLFNYFPTKQDLIDSVFFFIKEKMANHIMTEVNFEADIKDMLHETWRILILWAADHPLEDEVVNVLKISQVLSDDVREASEHFFAAIYEALENSMKDNIIIEIPVDFLCDLSAAYLRGTVSYARNNDIEKDELEQLIDMSFEIYWNGIKT